MESLERRQEVIDGPALAGRDQDLGRHSGIKIDVIELLQRARLGLNTGEEVGFARFRIDKPVGRNIDHRGVDRRGPALLEGGQMNLRALARMHDVDVGGLNARVERQRLVRGHDLKNGFTRLDHPADRESRQGDDPAGHR